MDKTDYRIGRHSALIPTRTHTWQANNAFYAIVPHPFKQYYINQVRQYFQWYDGYVDWFHNHDSGIFSTRLAYTVLHKLAEQTTGSKLLFDDEGSPDKHSIEIDGVKKNSLEFIEHWANERSLSTKATLAQEWAYVGGDSLLKLDNYDGKLNVSVVRKDNYFIDTGFDGELTAASMLIYLYTNMIREKDQAKEELFYLIEERKYDKDGNPKWRCTLRRGTGHMGTYKDVDLNSLEANEINFRDVPRNIREKLKRDYPEITFGEWQELPFKDLGVYMVKASERVSFQPSLPFGESLLSNNLHICMSYDFYYSAFNTDLYLGRGRVLMPEHLQNPHDNDRSDHYSGLDNFLFQKIPYVNPEAQSPTPLQFELRPEDWKTTRNNLLQTMATNIGISERTIATYIVPASEKPSAYEISSDENSTALFIENRRRFLKNALDKLIDNVLYFHEFGEEKVYAKFSKVGLTNINNIINQVTILRQNYLIDDRTALEMVFFDKTEKQIDNMLQKIEERRERDAESQQVQAERTADPVKQNANDVRKSFKNDTKPQEE